MPPFRRLLAPLFALILSLGFLIAGTQPTQASEMDGFQVCNSVESFGDILPYNSSYAEVISPHEGCTPELWPPGVLVDTDPWGPSHSYKIKVEGGSYGSCHTNSDNHASNPPNAYGKKVYYRNYDHGNCTN